MDLYKIIIRVVLWLFITVAECLSNSDCQRPIRPIYGGYHMKENYAIYYCRKGYGLLGEGIRYCNSGKWFSAPPVCVRAVSALVSNGHLLNRLTDNDPTTCVSVQKQLVKIVSSSISISFWLDETFSSAIVRVTMTPFGFGLEFPISINGRECGQILETNPLEQGIVEYDYKCSLVGIRESTLEIRIDRNIRSSICEIQLLPIKNVACPLSDLYGVNSNIVFDPEVYYNFANYGTAAIFSCNKTGILRGSKVRYCIEGHKWSGNQTFCEDISCPLSELSTADANITFHPEVSGETADYGTAAIYRCNKNITLRGSEIRYCIEGNKWSGNQTFCGEERDEASIVSKYFQVIVSSSVAAGFIVILVIMSICFILRRKRVKATNSSQDIQCYERGPMRISVIDHYYNTANYDYTENGIRDSIDSEDYDYCTVNETATIDTSTNWKFAQFTTSKPSSPVSLLNNEIYVTD